MKKISSKKMKIIWGSLGAGILLVPTVAISAVACSSEKNPINKPTITISAQPKNEIIFLNQPENLPTLSINATTSDSNAQLTYQWYENASNSTTGRTAISGATNSTYTIPQSDVTKTGTKYFYVVISAVVNNNLLNSKISNISRVTITNDIPAITVQTVPQAQEAMIGQTQNLPTFYVIASVGNLNEKLTYQWYYNTTDSTSNGTVIDGATKSSYQITPADVGSSATTKYFYVVVSGVINGVALTPLKSSVVSLTIKAKPTVTIKTQPSNQTVLMNQTAAFPTFSVVATPIENATFTYQWYSSTTDSNTNGTAIQDATKATYTITKTDIGTTVDSKKYFYVTVGGSIGDIKLTSVTSNAVSLTTQAASTITISTQPTAEQTVAKGASVTLTTVATTTSSSELSYQWKKYNGYHKFGPLWSNIEGANSSTYTFNATGEPGTVAYYMVTVSDAITDATAASKSAEVIFTTAKLNNGIINIPIR